MASLVRAEWRERGWATLGFAALFSVVAIGIAQSAGPHDPTETSLLVALAAPFAAVVVPAGVVDERASGFARMVRAQPLPSGAYALLKAGASAALLLLLIAPVVVATAMVEGAPVASALAGLALVCLWTGAAATLVGMLARGPGAATAMWVLVCVVNLLAIFATGPAMRMDDLLVRLRHVVPGPAALELTMPQLDPWLVRAPLVLLAEIVAVGLAAVASGAARGATVAACIALPFLLPAKGVA